MPNLCNRKYYVIAILFERDDNIVVVLNRNRLPSFEGRVFVLFIYFFKIKNRFNPLTTEGATKNRVVVPLTTKIRNTPLRTCAYNIM